MASSNSQAPSMRPDQPANARIPPAEAPAQSPVGNTVPRVSGSDTADDILRTPVRSSSGSGDSPFVPASDAVDGQQSGSSGNAPVPRVGVEDAGRARPEPQAAQEELPQPVRAQVPQPQSVALPGAEPVPLP